MSLKSWCRQCWSRRAVSGVTRQSLGLRSSLHWSTWRRISFTIAVTSYCCSCVDRQPLALVEDELSSRLILGSLPQGGQSRVPWSNISGVLWDGRDELRAAPVLDGLLGWLTLVIKLPVQDVAGYS